MANYEWLEEKGTKILFLHFASRNAEELEKKIEEFRAIIVKQPEHSLLTISDIADGHFDKTMKQMLFEFSRENEPYVKMSAVIGINGLQRVIYNGVLRASGRQNLVVKDSKEEAIAFLLTQ